MTDPRVQKLIEALGWYASREAWTIDQVEGSHGDYGKIAQKALAEFAKESPTAHSKSEQRRLEEMKDKPEFDGQAARVAYWNGPISDDVWADAHSFEEGARWMFEQIYGSGE